MPNYCTLFLRIDIRFTGSIIAGIQGPTVMAGSWFALLQSAGMGGIAGLQAVTAAGAVTAATAVTGGAVIVKAAHKSE